MRKVFGLIMSVLGALAIAVCAHMKVSKYSYNSQKSAAISIIGGPDGPASVFIAGKSGVYF